MTEIKKSIVAQGQSKIKNASIQNSKEIKNIKQKSFFLGFLSGIVASLLASIIYHLIEPYLFN